MKVDGKKIWDLLDWNRKVEAKKQILIQDTEIYPYFKAIFQSYKTNNHPKIADINDNLDNFDMYVPLLDDIPQNTKVFIGDYPKLWDTYNVSSSIIRCKCYFSD